MASKLIIWICVFMVAFACVARADDSVLEAAVENKVAADVTQPDPNCPVQNTLNYVSNLFNRVRNFASSPFPSG